MDYSKLSDFEINKLVAIALNIDMHFFIPESEDSFDSEIPSSKKGPIWQTSAYRVLQFNPSSGNCFNPCNNPADAWPIIVESGISLEFDGIDWMAYHCKCHSIKYSNSIETHAGKPLRAAMILWLMMREDKND